MPFKSQAQRRYMYANLPKIAKRWSKHTPKKKNLPEYVGEAVDKLSTKTVGTNLEFKSVIPNMDKTEASVFYKVKSEPGTDLVLVFSLGKSSDETDYQYGAVIDRHDPKGRPKKFEDPSSKETTEMLKVYGLTSEDIEMAGQDAYEQISQHTTAVPTLDEPYEESLEFETSVAKILNEEKSKV